MGNYLAFELDFLFILGCDVLDWADAEEGMRTHAVRSVPFRQTGLASGVSPSQRIHVGGLTDGVTDCRFWMRMKDSTICADC